jgi:hypothetical protein
MIRMTASASDEAVPLPSTVELLRDTMRGDADTVTKASSKQSTPTKRIFNNFALLFFSKSKKL